MSDFNMNKLSILTSVLNEYQKRNIEEPTLTGKEERIKLSQKLRIFSDRDVNNRENSENEDLFERIQNHRRSSNVEKECQKTEEKLNQKKVKCHFDQRVSKNIGLHEDFGLEKNATEMQANRNKEGSSFWQNKSLNCTDDELNVYKENKKFGYGRGCSTERTSLEETHFVGRNCLIRPEIAKSNEYKDLQEKHQSAEFCEKNEDNFGNKEQKESIKTRSIGIQKRNAEKGRKHEEKFSKSGEGVTLEDAEITKDWEMAETENGRYYLDFKSPYFTMNERIKILEAALEDIRERYFDTKDEFQKFNRRCMRIRRKRRAEGIL